MNGPQVHDCLFIVEIKLPSSKDFAFQRLWEVLGETELLHRNVNVLLGRRGGSCCTVGQTVFT